MRSKAWFGDMCDAIGPKGVRCEKVKDHVESMHLGHDADGETFMWPRAAPPEKPTPKKRTKQTVNSNDSELIASIVEQVIKKLKG